MEKGVLAIVHFMDEDGNSLSHSDFKIKFNLDSSYRHYSIVVKAIPVALKNLIK